MGNSISTKELSLEILGDTRTPMLSPIPAVHWRFPSGETSCSWVYFRCQPQPQLRTLKESVLLTALPQGWAWVADCPLMDPEWTQSTGCEGSWDLVEKVSWAIEIPVW